MDAYRMTEDGARDILVQGLYRNGTVTGKAVDYDQAQIIVDDWVEEFSQAECARYPVMVPQILPGPTPEEALAALEQVGRGGDGLVSFMPASGPQMYRTPEVCHLPFMHKGTSTGGTVQMDLGEFLRIVADGEGHGWSTEMEYLKRHRAKELEELTERIRAEGVQEPVHVGSDGRCWDGHHRVTVAQIIGLKTIPVMFT